MAGPNLKVWARWIQDPHTRVIPPSDYYWDDPKFWYGWMPKHSSYVPPGRNHLIDLYDLDYLEETDCETGRYLVEGNIAIGGIFTNCCVKNFLIERAKHRRIQNGEIRYVVVREAIFPWAEFEHQRPDDLLPTIDRLRKEFGAIITLAWLDDLPKIMSLF